MAGFNRFGSGGLGSLYPGVGGLGAGRRPEDRFDDRMGRDLGRPLSYDRRDDRDFARLQREPSPRRRRYSPEPPYSSMRGRRDDRGELGGYSMDRMGGHDSFSSRGQRNSDIELSRAGRNMGHPNLGDGILGAKPGDISRNLASNAGSGVNPIAAQQQQHLMAVMQTQSLLAAIQAQASAAAKQVGQPPSLLQGLRPNNDRGRTGFMDRNRKRRMSPNRGQMRNRNQQQGNRQMNRQNSGNNSGNIGGNRRRHNYNRDRDRMEKYIANKRNDTDHKSYDAPQEEPYVEENPDDEEEEVKIADKEQPEKQDKKEETKQETKVKDEEPKEKEDKATKENTEKTDAKASEEEVPKSSINLAGQNVDKLTKSLFDRSRGKYVCKVCKIMCTKETCFRQHLFGRRHVKTWLENQGQSFEAVIFKKATEEAAKTLSSSDGSKSETTKATEQDKEKMEDVKEKEEDKEKPSESKESETAAQEKEVKTEPVKTEPVKEEKKKEQVLDVKYSCESRKMAFKDGEYITITCINENRVRINGFDTGINTEGCEFVKAVTGFQCRLCRSFINNGQDVMKHVQGGKHQYRYRMYLRDHPKYESNQKVRNKDLADMLKEREGEAVLLYEVSDEEEERNPSRHGRSEDIKPIRYVAAYHDVKGDVDESMEEDRHDSQDDSQDTEPHNDDNLDQSKEEDASHDDEDGDEDDNDEDQENDDGHDEDQDDDEGEGEGDDVIHEVTEETKDKDNDISIEDGSEENQSMISDLLQDSDEDKVNSEEVADLSIEANVSLSELVKDTSEDEPITKKLRTAPAAKRGRKTTRGAAQSGRGRGRGRAAAKKNTRQSPKAASRGGNNQVDMMEGFEVIDELSDEEN